MPVRILVVDDHSLLREGLRLRLQQEPDMVVVGEAGTVGEALERLDSISADIVLMDLNLPGEGGLVGTERIRARWPDTRVIMFTGDGTAAAANAAIRAGANGFLRKVDAAEELVRAVRAVAAGKTYLSPDAATALAQALLSRIPPERAGQLTERELAVLKGLAAGQSYKEIAGDLGVSAKSVETYRARMVRKTGCNTRAELVRYAIRNGIVEA